MATLPQADTLRILSLDGGGIKGYTTLLILRRIMRTLSQEAGMDGDIRPCDVFDLIAGTSTGGLIAVMLGRLHMTVDECIKSYERIGSKIFGKQLAFGSVGKLIKGTSGSAFYSIEKLQGEIRSVLTELKMPVDQQFLKTDAPRCKVMLCVTRTATSKPDVLRNYLSAAPTAENYKCKIWEAASATAAAPIYFKPVRFKESNHQFADGGMHRNNPVNESLAEVARERSWQNKKVGCLVSIGNGSVKITSLPSNLASFLKKAVDMLTDSERIADDFELSQQGRELAEQNRYFRFNVPQGLEDLELDDYKETEQMDALTTYYLSKAGSGREVERCAKSLLNPDANFEAKQESMTSVLPGVPHMHFIKRPLYTNALRRFFHTKSETRQVFVLWGMGGIGKSQIALDFGNIMKTSLSVYWVRADKFTNFVSDYQLILGRLSPDKTSDTGPMPFVEILERTVRLLEQRHSSFLLLVDNADDLYEFTDPSKDGLSMSMFLPRNGRVLITTRDPRFLGEFAPADNGMQVHPMRLEEATELLFTSVPRHLSQSNHSKQRVEELLEELGYLPLAVAQAAANIRDQQISIVQYSQAYRDKKRRLGLMDIPVKDVGNRDPRSAAQSILVTWELSFEILENRDPLSAACLSYMGFLDRRTIPQFLLMALPEFENLEDAEQQRVVSRLLQLSLIEQVIERSDIREYNIHPVVHDRILSRLPAEQVRQRGELLAALLRTVFPNCRLPMRDVQRDLAKYLLPHVLNVSDTALSANIVSESVVTLVQLLAAYFDALGFSGLALSLIEQGYDLALQVWPQGDLSMLSIIDDKLEYLHREEKYDEVMSICDQIVDPMLASERIKGQLSPSDYDKAWDNVLQFRALALLEKGRYEEQLFLVQN